MKNLCYFGETIDYSDQWLVSLFQKYYNVFVIEPKIGSHKSIKCDILINRLYGSIATRHSVEKIRALTNIIRRFEKKRTPSINSLNGYSFDLDRVKQYDFFARNGVPFAQTIPAVKVLSKEKNIQFPCVLKSNSASRNKDLVIIRNANTLKEFPDLEANDWVLQTLIKDENCYRTEFIGGNCLTFTQLITFRESDLGFKYTQRIISTPLNSVFRKHLCRIVNNLNIQVFSIEYFIRGGLPYIIDFNMTSNYQPFFIKKVHDRLHRSWMNLIKNETHK